MCILYIIIKCIYTTAVAGHRTYIIYVYYIYMYEYVYVPLVYSSQLEKLISMFIVTLFIIRYYIIFLLSSAPRNGLKMKGYFFLKMRFIIHVIKTTVEPIVNFEA